MSFASSRTKSISHYNEDALLFFTYASCEDGIGNIFNDIKIQGKTAAAMKKVVDDRVLLIVGGPKAVLKKGKFRPF